MTPFRTLFLFAVCSTAVAHAQVTYTAGHVIFKNPGSFTQDQLEATAQMHPGATFKAPELTAAAQRLSDSGYFDNVGATVAGKVSAVDVIFDLQPSPRQSMLPVTFGNFVWLTHDQIEAAIHATYPLFCDYLPETGPQTDVVAAALTQALAAQSITAEVVEETVEPTLTHPERVIEFRVTKPSITVVNVKLGGVTPDLAPLLQKSVNAVARKRYDEGILGARTTDAILAPLLEAGYIEAALSAVKLDPTPTLSGDTGVVLSAVLQPGEIYRVSHLEFAGTPLVTPQAFAAKQKLHDGDIASHSALLETLQPVDAAYRRQGYMDVTIHAEPTLDRAQHTVAYTVSVVPGEPYHVREIKAQGLDPAAQAEFDRNVPLQPGSIFNPFDLFSFIGRNPNLHALKMYGGATFKAYASPSTHTVDVIMSFSPSTVTVTPTSR